MLDKSIPYKDLIMKWDGNRQCLLPVCVPPGYRLRTWREGDQKNWARIQKEAGEFGDMTLEQTEAWFLQEYGDRKEELSFRCLFAESMDKEADGVCMAWTEAGTDGSLIPSLHWLAVRDAKKARALELPWSERPCGYSQAGERSRSFCTPSPGATRLLACI